MFDSVIPFISFLAHVNPGSGAVEGFLHPILGTDHLIAMVTVGLLSAAIGGRAIWTVPAAFLLAMLGGGILGLIGIPLPFVEIGISISVLILGVLIFMRAALPEWIAMLTVGAFGVFHGYAHGAELPQISDITIIIAYVVGFLVATAGLHVIGALIGYIALRNKRGTMALRVVGVVVALFGVFFLTQL
jgi:urease accessory protein